jgi:translation initiation factor IF-3
LQKTRINQQITAPQIRVVTDEGEQLGVFTLSQALQLAEEHGLDLVEIAPHAKPPVVKLIAYDKFRYQQKKQEQQQRKNAKKVEVKTIRLSAKIAEHDISTKARAADGFLLEGDLIRVELRMRGREQAFGDLAEAQLRTFQAKLTSPFRVETPIKRMGSVLSVTLAPATK